MQLYIDFLGPDDCYRAGEQAMVDDALPLDVLRSPAFVEASCGVPATGAARLVHIEHARYVDADSLGDAGIRGHDSLVVVCAVGGAFPRAGEVRVRWSAAGGALRRELSFPLPAHELATAAPRWVC